MEAAPTSWFDNVKRALGVDTSRQGLTDERKTFRIECDLPARVSLADGRNLKARVVNVSSQGMRVQLDSAVKARQQVDVALQGRTRARDIHLTGEVVWCRRIPGTVGFHAGLRFLAYDTTDPKELLRQLEPNHPATRVDNRQKRRSQRLACSLEVDIVLPDGAQAAGVARDISRRGVLIVMQQPVTAGTELNLRIRLDAAAAVSARGTVKRCTRMDGGSQWETACFLAYMPIEDRMRLEKALLRLRS